MTPSEFSTYMYDLLPEVYKRYDTKSELKLYLETLSIDGFADILIGEAELINLIDPYKCPEKFLPVFCRCFGLNYYPDIPPKYHRKLLANIEELNSRIGTYNCVRYLCRVLTGLEIVYRVELLQDESGKSLTLYIDLKAKTIEDITNIEMSTKVIERFIGDFIPYYFTSVVINGAIDEVVAESVSYTACAITIRKEILLPRNYYVE